MEEKLIIKRKQNSEEIKIPAKFESYQDLFLIIKNNFKNIKIKELYYLDEDGDSVILDEDNFKTEIQSILSLEQPIIYIEECGPNENEKTIKGENNSNRNTGINSNSSFEILGSENASKNGTDITNQNAAPSNLYDVEKIRADYEKLKNEYNNLKKQSESDQKKLNDLEKKNKELNDIEKINKELKDNNDQLKKKNNEISDRVKELNKNISILKKNMSSHIDNAIEKAKKNTEEELKKEKQKLKGDFETEKKKLKDDFEKEKNLYIKKIFDVLSKKMINLVEQKLAQINPNTKECAQEIKNLFNISPQ